MNAATAASPVRYMQFFITMQSFEILIDECDNNISFYTKHLEDLRRNIALQDDAKIQFQSFNPEMDFTDFVEAEQFNSYTGYVIISILDLSVNLKNLILCKTDWERIFFVKYSYLIIHETINKLKPSKGKSFVQLTIENHYPKLKYQLFELLTDIENFKSNVDYKKIEDTRHFTAGHIEKNLKKYYDTILNLNGDEAAQFISDFLKFLHKALILTKDYAVEATAKQNEKAKKQSEELELIIEKLLNFLK